MKLYLPILLLQAAALSAVAQAIDDNAEESTNHDRIRYQLIQPDEKTPEMVKPNETNPFNKGDGSRLKAEDISSAETKVKDALNRMSVTGITRDRDGNVVSCMLGGIKLERGMTVPPVVADQEVFLRVNSISESTIEMFWIEQKKRNMGLPQRAFILPIDVTTPYVRYAMPKADSEVVPASKKGAATVGGFARQIGPSVSDVPLPASNETRRAVVLDETGTSQPPPMPGSQPPAGSTPAGTPSQSGDHPANLLMKMLMGNNPVPAQQPAGSLAPKQP